MRFSRQIFVAMALLLLAGAVARQASAQCCRGCGCDSGHKVCRLVCEEKEVKIPCWGSECEEFCVSGPCKMGCRQCEKVCESCCDNGCCESCCDGGCCGSGCSTGSCGIGGKWFSWRVTIPSCAKIFTKKKLMKRTVTKKVCVYKWKIEDLCCKCESGCQPVDVPQGAFVPPRPDVNAVFIDGKKSPANKKRSSVQISLND